MRSVEFVVYGHAQPQGSARAFYKQGMKRAIITTDNVKLKPWRQEVANVALNLNEQQFEGAVKVAATFYYQRPASVSERRRPLPIVKPDIDKAARGILDAITGILVKDDAQVVNLHVRKLYGSPERAEITISDICE